MNLTIHQSFLPHTDPDDSLAFYRDVLGFELRNDVGNGTMRWLTMGPPDQPDTSIVLMPVGVDPNVTDGQRRAIADMMAAGTYTGINLATADLDDTFAALEQRGAEITQPPTDQPWGVRDCVLTDPAGTPVRIFEVA